MKGIAASGDTSSKRFDPRTPECAGWRHTPTAPMEGRELAGLFRSDTSGGSISLNASIFANKGPKGLAGTDCAGVRGSLASPRPYCVYPHGWCARPVPRGNSVSIKKSVAGHDPTKQWINPSRTHRSGRSAARYTRTVCMMSRWPRKCRCAGAPSGSDLWTVMAGAPTSLGRARDGARAGGRRSFCRHSGGQGGVNRPNERSVIRQQDELCRS